MAIEVRRMTYSVEEAATIVGVSKWKLYDMLRSGELQGVHVGRRVVIPCNALEGLIKPLAIGERSERLAAAHPTAGQGRGGDGETELNAVHLSGSIVHQPQLRLSRTGLAICTLRLAVPRRRRDGEQRGAFHIDIIAFGAVAEAAAHLACGDHVAVIGRLGQREWTSSHGSQHARFEIVADELRPSHQCELREGR